METEDFHKTGEFGPVSKLEKSVKTPTVEKSETRYSSDYEAEENRLVVYELNEHYVQVAKIGNRGWNVKRYDTEGLDEREGYFDEEQEAHEVAREMVEEVAADE